MATKKEELLREGFFGDYGGRFVPPPLEKPLQELTDAFQRLREQPSFQEELAFHLKHFVGRPNPLYFAERLTDYAGGAKIFLKREDLNHTGSHKINNAMGQALLARELGKKRLIAETGAGQHGVATATVASFFDLDCTVFMGAEDVIRQQMNVFRMELLGAEVVSVETGTRTLKDAVDKALETYAGDFENSFYLLGSAVGPHPYPTIVRDFQSIIGREAREQIIEATGKLPDYLVACVGGGSNAIGLFHPFLEDDGVAIIGVEPAGEGLGTNQHAASISRGSPGIIHGFKCYTLQDEKGQPLPVHSIAPGLDYPGVGPEHSYLRDTGRISYESITDREALETFRLLSKEEGIIPALESAHAVAYAIRLAKTLTPEKTIVVNLSGRGDKDVAQVARYEEEGLYK